MLRKLGKKIVFKIPFLFEKYKTNLIKSKAIVKLEEHFLDIDSASKVMLESNNNLNGILVGLVRDMFFEQDDSYISPRSYFPKYERFLKNNNIAYEYYDILSHNWIEEAEKFDVIIWHTSSDPNSQFVAGNKIYLLDKILKKKCLPNFEEIWSYEDKINAHYLFKTFNLPEIPTYVSHSRSDAEKYLQNAKFPIISKLSTGSSSFGVEKVRSLREGVKILNKVFSASGRSTYFPYEKQKNYVYFQQFMEDATFDLRIVTIGNKAFGYYRFPNKGDFKASGSGIYKKTEIPFEALDLAFKVKELYKARCLATDLLFSEKYNKYYIIESSIFIGIDTPIQLEIEGVPGYYKRLADNEYTFVEGQYWLQELALQELFKENLHN